MTLHGTKQEYEMHSWKLKFSFPQLNIYFKGLLKIEQRIQILKQHRKAEIKATVIEIRSVSVFRYVYSSGRTYLLTSALELFLFYN